MEKDNKVETNKSTNWIVIIIISILAIVAVVIGILCVGKLLEKNDDDSDTKTEKSISKEKDSNTNKSSKKNDKKDDEPQDDIEGSYYEIISLKDPQSNVNVFEGIIPEGWTASVKSNYQVVSPDYPILESVTISSPDGKANIYIDSQQEYCESSSMGEGVSEEYYTTYLHYMDADEFIEYYMNLAYNNSSLVDNLETDKTLLNQAKQLQKIKVEKAKNSFAQIFGGSYSSMGYDVKAGEVTASKQQYKTSNSYLEASCVIIPIQMTIGSSYYDLTNTYWEIPYSIVFEADDKKTFEKYYDDYNFIIANSHFTTDCYALVEYASSCVLNVKSAEAAAKSKASLNAMNDYIDSNYSSTSSASTNEKVMGMWDDYINEVDEYTTLDGGSIKTSMYNDVVAQDGDKIFVGSSTSDIPSGYEELSKAY